MPQRLGFTTQPNELQQQPLPVSGRIPTWLSGTLIRNGPAMFEVEFQPYRHWFDGLAMLHNFAFREGQISHSNRFLGSDAFKDASRTRKIVHGECVTNGRNPKLRLAKQSVERLKSRVRAITARRRGVSIHRMVEELNRFLRGWIGYFRLPETPSRFEELDGWVRRRLRCFLLSQWKAGRGRRGALHRLGGCDAGNISWSRKGPQRLSKTQQTHQGLNVAYFRCMGLLSPPISGVRWGPWCRQAPHGGKESWARRR